MIKISNEKLAKLLYTEYYVEHSQCKGLKTMCKVPIEDFQDSVNLLSECYHEYGANFWPAYAIVSSKFKDYNIKVKTLFLLKLMEVSDPLLWESLYNTIMRYCDKRALSHEELHAISKGLTQILSKGCVKRSDFNQLSEVIPESFPLLREVVVDLDIIESEGIECDYVATHQLLSAGKLSAGVVIPAWCELLDEKLNKY